MRSPSPGLRIGLLSLAIAVSQLATSLYLPSLPSMAGELGVGPSVASWTLTVFYISYAVFNLLAGPLADGWGRRPVLVAGLAVYSVGTALCASAPSIGLFLAGRVIQAAGAAAAPVVGRAMLRDVQGEGGGTRAMIWVSLAMAAAPALGPPLGGLIQQDAGWRWTFWVLLILGLAMLLAAQYVLNETLPPAARTAPHRLAARYVALLHDRAYRGNVGALSCLFAGLGVFFATGPFVFIQLFHFTPLHYGELNLLNVAGYLAGSTVAGRLSRRVPAPALVKGGTLLALAGGVVMVLLAGDGVMTAGAVLGPVVMLTFGFGIVLPAATSAALDRHPGEAGLASALLGFIQIGAAAAGTAVAGAVLGGASTLPLACVFLALTAAAAVCGGSGRPPQT